MSRCDQEMCSMRPAHQRRLHHDPAHLPDRPQTAPQLTAISDELHERTTR